MTDSQLIDGTWSLGRGADLQSIDPSTGSVYWSTRASDDRDIDSAVASARGAARGWASTPLSQRKDVLERFGKLAGERTEDLARTIAVDNGKPLWEARTEVNSLKTKISATIDAFAERAGDRSIEVNGRLSVTRFRPHGVLAVLGPFNFPMSMPNSHVMPAIYAGNAVVLKPSEATPVAAVAYTRLWEDAGLPRGVLNLLQGGGDVGAKLAAHDDIDGVLFIGSHRVGINLAETLASKTGKQLALEMGGNAPLVVWDYSDLRAAIHIVIQSAFVSAGQRCTAARRLIVNSSIADEFLLELTRAVDRIIVGRSLDDEQPFMGPMIGERAASKFLEEVDALRRLGAFDLAKASPIPELGPAFVRPGLIDTTGVETPDIEVFGPLLQVKRVESLKEAIDVANATRFGLAAGIVSKERDVFDAFLADTKAGIVNWNQPITGATTFAPFGGVKASGNFRPAGFLSADYCSYATASIEDAAPTVPTELPPGLDY